MSSKDFEKSLAHRAVEPELQIGEALPKIPGTELLVDIEHRAGGIHGGKDVVLIPAPSSDPDDPLNWSSTRKWTAMGVVCLWAFMLGGATLSPSITYNSLVPEFGVDVTFLNIGAAVALFNLGFFNVFLSPLSMKYGRRPVYLASAIVSAISQIVCAASTNKAAWMVGRVLLGAAAAPFEQLPALTVDDQFFVHERGLGLSLYVTSIAAGSFLGPVAGGFVVVSMGWRWVYWFYAIFMGLIAVIIYVGLEETTFDRRLHEIAEESSEGERQLLGVRKSFWDMRPLYVVRTTNSSMLKTMWRPFRLAHLPIIFWCGIMYGFAVTWLSVMAVTLSTVFMDTHYHFSASATGLTMLGPLVGSLLFVYIGGKGTDRFLVWKAKRNGGVMQAEFRLYSIFIAGPMFAAGLILYGVGAAHEIHWFGLIVGMALIGIGLPISAEVALGYSIEAYPSLAGEVTVIVVLIRNTIGCAMTFAIEPWIEHSGLQNTFIAVGVLALFAMVSGGIFVIWGEKCRGRSYNLVMRMNKDI